MVSKDDESEYKGLSDLYKEIDNYMASMIDRNNEVLSSEKEYVDLLKKEVKYMQDIELGALDINKARLETLGLQNEFNKYNKTTEEQYQAELKMLYDKYEFELTMLNLKQQALLTNHNLTMANLSSEEARLKNVENAGIASLQLQTKGFATGGYTGNGGKYDVAGVVHKNEYVIPNNIVNSNPEIIQMLEAMRTGKKGYALGGLVGDYNSWMKNAKGDNYKFMLSGNDKTNINEQLKLSKITEYMAKLGYAPKGQTLDTDKYIYHAYKNGLSTANVKIAKVNKKLNGNYTINFTIDTTKKSKGYLSPTAEVEGAEKFSDSNRNFFASKEQVNNSGKVSLVNVNKTDKAKAKDTATKNYVQATENKTKTEEVVKSSEQVAKNTERVVESKNEVAKTEEHAFEITHANNKLLENR